MYVWAKNKLRLWTGERSSDDTHTHTAGVTKKRINTACNDRKRSLPRISHRTLRTTKHMRFLLTVRVLTQKVFAHPGGSLVRLHTSHNFLFSGNKTDYGTSPVCPGRRRWPVREHCGDHDGTPELRRVTTEAILTLRWDGRFVRRAYQ